MNNVMRAHSAQRAVDSFALEMGLTGEDLETCLSDLLCNLKHLALHEGIEFAECLERAESTHQQELADD